MIDFRSTRETRASAFDNIQVRIASPEEMRGPKDPKERERLEMAGNEEESTLKETSLFYLPQNQRPRVTDVSLAEPPDRQAGAVAPQGSVLPAIG